MATKPRRQTIATTAILAGDTLVTLSPRGEIKRPVFSVASERGQVVVILSGGASVRMHPAGGAVVIR